MEKTGVKVSDEDLEKLRTLVTLGWKPGDRMIVFSVGEGIKRDQTTVNAQKICHQLALDYGLPEIPVYYGINKDGEFIKS